MAIKLIVGLGNPGSAYEGTRHNAGAWFVEALAHHYDQGFSLEKKMQGRVAKIEVSSLSCALFLPSTFMNQSGIAIRAFTQFYRIAAEEILLCHDELDLPVGKIKLKTGGGHGGHNGLRNTMDCLQSKDFHRLRIGIAHPGHRDEVLNYVLGKPSKKDKDEIIHAFTPIIPSISTLLQGEIMRAMNVINQ